MKLRMMGRIAHIITLISEMIFDLEEYYLKI